MKKGIVNGWIIFMVWGMLISGIVWAEPMDAKTDLMEQTEVSSEPGQSAEVSQADDILFTMTDPEGDDWGPGTYTYPRP